MVTFYLVNPERKKSAIAILISFGGKKYRRSVGESIPVKYWNNTKKRAKVTVDFTFGNDINDVLTKWDIAANKVIGYYKDFFHAPPPDEFFARLDKEYYKDDINAKNSETVLFSNYLQTYIDRYRKVRSNETIKKYITAQNKLADYESENRKKLRFDDININFYNDFQYWFYQKGFSDNYFGSVIKIIKQAYKEAKQVDKLHKFDDIEHKDFIVINKASENIYLSEDELMKIHRLEITPELVLKHFPDLSEFRVEQKIKSMNLVRDRFLIGAYTGLRVSDFSRLNEMNIGNHIRIKTSKTGANVVIPIHPVIQDILDSGFDTNITISEQKINLHIKKVGLLAGITENVMLSKHVAGTIKETTTEKYKLICTHTARRSFATNTYKAGVPTIAIMKITGHTRESTFLKYIKVSEEENADMLKNHPFFNIK